MQKLRIRKKGLYKLIVFAIQHSRMYSVQHKIQLSKLFLLSVSLCSHFCSLFQSIFLQKMETSEGQLLKNPPKKTNDKLSSVSLTSMAQPILQIIKAKGPVSFPEVADDFFAMELYAPSEKGKQERNIRRRIYDVLNVLIACNIITKDYRKRVKIFDPADELTDSESTTKAEIKKLQNNRIAKKTELLISKTRLLIYYRLLMARNKNTERTEINVQMPTIVLGYREEDGKIVRSLDGKKLTIFSNIPPLFFSPENIFCKLKFSAAEQVQQLQTLTYLSSKEKDIIDAIQKDEINSSSLPV